MNGDCKRERERGREREREGIKAMRKDPLTCMDWDYAWV